MRMRTPLHAITKQKTLALLSSIIFTASLFTVSLFTASSAFAEVYTIDAAHSSVAFRIRHLALSSVNGAFGDFEGKITFDEKNVAASKVEASIDVSSISTQNTKRDDHLRSPDFFATEKFPKMSFTSQSVKVTGEKTFQVEGILDMHGVKKPVVLDVEYLGAGQDPQGNARVGFSAKTKLNRKDFGLTWSKVLETGALVVGEDVEISLDVQGVLEK